MTKTDLFLLGLTVLFLLAVALTWLLTPRTARGDYEIEAEQPTEDAAQLRMVNINTAGVDELDSLPGIGPVLAQRHPEVLALQEALLETGALGAQLTGTGSVVFGLYPTFDAARAAAAQLRGNSANIFVAAPV